MEKGLEVHTISQIDVLKGRSEVDLIKFREDIEKWIDTNDEKATYDPLTEGPSSQDDNLFTPESPYIDQVVDEMIEAFGRATNRKLELVDYWVHIHTLNMSTERHHHYPHDVSGVFYITVPPESGSLVMFPAFNKFHPDRILFPPEEGVFLLFPAVLEHGVTRSNFPYPSKEKRISISFNFNNANRGPIK